MPNTVTKDQAADIYRAAFDQVCNPADWKAEVDCVVPYELANLYKQAIEFMVGAPVTGCKVEGGMYHLRSIGYRAGPCGS